jgi:hypothetical protein
MQDEGRQQQKISVPIVLAKPLSPEKNGVNHAQAVENHGEQKIMSVGEPTHTVRLNHARKPASAKILPV